MKRTSWILSSLALAVSLTMALAIGAPAIATAGGGGDDAHGAHDAHDAHDAHGHHSTPPLNWFNLDYKSVDGYGQELAPQSKAHSMAPPLGLALMNFGAFFFLLVWKGGPPISNYLRGRHSSIKEALEEGQRLRDEATSKLEEYSDKIKGVEAEVDALIAEVRESAEGEKNRIIAEAERSAELMKKAADAQITADISRARAELEAEVMRAAIAATELILREKATAGDHQKLIDGFLVDLAATGASATTTTETSS